MRRVAARYRWDRLRVSFWFTPAAMALGAVLLAWAMYWLDNHISNEALGSSHFIMTGTVGELRGALLNMATTTLATAGVVFTLLTLPLSTVAAQYGSRLLRVFLGDRTIQFVLGMFVATFVYCIAAAMSVLPVTVQPQGPQITATVGLLLMIATFASLILLVQHISTMLQAPNVAAAAGSNLREAMRGEISDEFASSEHANQSGQGAPHDLAEIEAFPVRVDDTGYVQYIETSVMFTLAREHDLVIRLVRKPGDFVSPGVAVALVWPGAAVNENLEGQLLQAFQVGNARTPTQDVEYAVNQLVEMAVRAMSPAINDPFTAMTCLDYLGEGLGLFSRQGQKASFYDDRNGCLRVIVEPLTFDCLLGAAFNMLRHASCENATVLLHMLEVIDVVGREAKLPGARQALLLQSSLIEAESQVGHLTEQDQRAISLRVERLRTKWQATSI